MKRAATPTEIGRLAMFLASEDSAYVTGSTYVMDGRPHAEPGPGGLIPPVSGTTRNSPGPSPGSWWVMMLAGHRRMHRAVDAYVDGELRTPERIAAVQAHLDQCWGCSGYAETVRLLKRSLRRLADRQPTDLGVARLRRWATTDLLP